MDFIRDTEHEPSFLKFTVSLTNLDWTESRDWQILKVRKNFYDHPELGEQWTMKKLINYSTALSIL